MKAVFVGRADRGDLEGILAYSEDPIVASDIVGSPYSGIFDVGFTMGLRDPPVRARRTRLRTPCRPRVVHR